jgi:hypothetical protein
MILKIIYSAILITILTACDTNVPVVSKADGTNKIGSDRDMHGCIGSAGYSWCAKTKLAQTQKFEKTLEAFDNYCGNK